MDRSTSVTTYSQQHLVVNEEINNSGSSDVKQSNSSINNNNNNSNTKISKKEWITVLILCFINLINYMDRMTIAGILDEIQTHFKVENDTVGLLQTAFIVSYMIFAPLFGYLGDRYNRKIIMSVGIFLWSLTTLLGSYQNNFYWFLFYRMCVGIGEASYSTIAPTIISDLFIKDTRSKMLALFYFAIPVGSGLGYITGSKMLKLTGQWQWALRLTPPLGILTILLIYLFVRDPPKGEKEGGSHVTTTSWSNDIKALINNPSFMLSTGGFTCVSFVTGALSFWAPKYLQLGIDLQNNGINNQLDNNINNENDNSATFSFGVIAMTAGIIGVPLGSYMAQKLRLRWQQADPLICAFGLFISAPFVFLALISANGSTYVCYVLIFFGQLLLNLNWSIVADILLYIVIPTRRSTAEAFQILVAHALGDAGSPYLIGVVSNAITPMVRELSINTNDKFIEFRSIQYALFLTIFIEIIGSLFFFITALHIEKDKSVVDLTIAENFLETKNNGQAESTRL
ncbi:hypothetical protein HCN44_003127 [Aphidius gifuensis]|uniref:Major facilitator superfamily (MFS) profile domain-containing protein n=1 Tax=Aphidius gifuensis TaxID=684658 RepID=A0A835CNS1_APHGI|nr:protein spinster isoform X3 [Aphidius gifuensis]KAF7987365.1 hypothetical protein HCN44_003127 [Aphidius gifuensis]